MACFLYKFSTHLIFWWNLLFLLSCALLAGLAVTYPASVEMQVGLFAEYFFVSSKVEQNLLMEASGKFIEFFYGTNIPINDKIHPFFPPEKRNHDFPQEVSDVIGISTANLLRKLLHHFDTFPLNTSHFGGNPLFPGKAIFSKVSNVILGVDFNLQKSIAHVLEKQVLLLPKWMEPQIEAALTQICQVEEISVVLWKNFMLMFKLATTLGMILVIVNRALYIWLGKVWLFRVVRKGLRLQPFQFFKKPRLFLRFVRDFVKKYRCFPSTCSFVKNLIWITFILSAGASGFLFWNSLKMYYRASYMQKNLCMQILIYYNQNINPNSPSGDYINLLQWIALE